MKVRELLSLEVEDIALGGKALARLDGKAVFVDRGLPGDKLTARVKKAKRGFIEARMVTLEGGSPHRIPAICAHVNQCGGCRFQDMDYAEQAKLKERQVRETLQHLGGIESPAVLPIRTAPEAFRYRNKMEFTFHPSEDGTAALGMHERGHFDRVFDLKECHLPSELTVEIVQLTRRFANQNGWQAYHSRRHTGLVRFLAVRHLPLTSECGVQLIAASGDVPDIKAWASEIAALSPEVKTVTLGINRSRSNVAFAEEERVLHGEGVIVERLRGLEFEAPANAFLQTNSRQAEHLYEAAIRAADLQPDERVLDLYCGTGTMTMMFAREAAEVIGVESVADAVSSARRNAKRNGIDNVRFAEGEARRVLREWQRGERPDVPNASVVVVDPPRAGLHPRVVFRVAELAPRRIVYVSCNPATLARDLKDFAEHGYGLIDIEPFDMFPHTPHIECVARLEPVKGLPG